MADADANRERSSEVSSLAAPPPTVASSEELGRENARLRREAERLRREVVALRSRLRLHPKVSARRDLAATGDQLQEDDAKQRLTGDELQEGDAARLPSLLQMAGNLAGAAGRSLYRVARGAGVLATEEAVTKRRETCRSNLCLRYVADHDRCAECGCFVSAKTRLASESCPRGFWRQEDGGIPGESTKGDRVEHSEKMDHVTAIVRTQEPGQDSRLIVDEDRPRWRETIGGAARHVVGKGQQEQRTVARPPSDSDDTSRAGRAGPDADAVITVFLHPECGACAAVGPALMAVRRKIGWPIAVREIDVQAWPYVAARLGIQAVPTLLVHRGGDVVARFEGATLDPAEIAESLIGGRDGLLLSTGGREGGRMSPPPPAQVRTDSQPGGRTGANTVPAHAGGQRSEPTTPLRPPYDPPPTTPPTTTPLPDPSLAPSLASVEVDHARAELAFLR